MTLRNKIHAGLETLVVGCGLYLLSLAGCEFIKTQNIYGEARDKNEITRVEAERRETKYNLNNEKAKYYRTIKEGAYK